MHSISLDSNSIKKNFKVALKTCFHLKKDDRYKIYVNYDYRNPLYINEDINKNIKSILSEIMKIKLISDNFPRQFLKENIFKILYDLFFSLNNNFSEKDFELIYSDLIKQFENKINEEIKYFNNYEYFFKIINLDLKSSLKIGNVTFFKLSEFNLEHDDFYKSSFFDSVILYARVNVFGSRKYTLSQAEVKVKMALNILKFLLNDEQFNFNLEGDTFYRSKRGYIVKNEKNSGFGAYVLGSYIPCELTENNIENIYFYLNELSNIFLRENRSDFENRLLTAIYWFGESLSYKIKSVDNSVGNNHENNIDNFEFFEYYPKFLSLIIVLETLFVFGNEKKSEAISLRVSNLIAKPEHYGEIKSFLEDIYENRSKMVHAGIISITKKDLEKLTKYTQNAILHLIDINLIYYNEINYFKKIY